MTQGGPRDFFGLKFWPKGIFWICGRRGDFARKTQIVLGYCTFHHLKSTIT